MNQPRFYAACLSSYNNGILHGAWIDASESVEEMAESISEMLEKSPTVDAEEWAIHDSEGLGLDLGEHVGLGEVARRVRIVEVADENGVPPEVLLEAMTEDGTDADPSDFVSDRYQGQYDTWEHFAEELWIDCGKLDRVSEEVSQYIDWEAVGRDLRYSGDFFAYDDDCGRIHIFWNH